MHAPILVLTALVWEAQAVLRSLDNVRDAGQRTWRGNSGRCQVIVSSGGVGIRSARAIVEIYKDIRPSVILSVGCSGALVPELSAGQLLLAKAVSMYGGDDRTDLKTFPSDPNLLAAAKSAAMARGMNPVVGSIFTSPHVLSTGREKDICQRQTSCIAVEMESAVHAEFAAGAGVPFLAIRPILDTMRMTIPQIKGIIGSKGEVNVLRALGRVGKHPKELVPLMRLQRCRRLVSVSIATISSAFFPVLESVVLADLATRRR